MYAGSSALQNEQTKQASTPAVRVNLQENYNLRTTVPFSSLSRVYSAYTYADRYFLVGTTPGGAIWVETYDAGLSKINALNLGLSSVDSFDWWNNGSTLTLFYEEAVGTSNYIRTIATANGSAWGGSALVLGVSGQIASLATVGPTRLYYIGRLGTTIGTLGTINEGQINRVENTGSWGLTVLSHRNFWYYSTQQGVQDPDTMIQAANIDNEDRLLFRYADAPMYGDGLKVVRTDGFLNVFGEENLLTSTSFPRSINITNQAKGGSNFYVGIQTVENVYQNQGGVTVRTPVPYPPSIVQSVDFLSWSAPRPIIGSTRIYTSNSLPIGHVGSLLAGTTPSTLEFIWLGVSQSGVSNGVSASAEMNFNVFKGSTPLNVSNDIVSYTNSNNKRISLTLSNVN